MNISRTTVTEIYAKARYKISECLVKGKQLSIKGGNYQICHGQTACAGQPCKSEKILSEKESTFTKLPFWEHLSGQERALTEIGSSHRAYEKGVYIFDYSDSCMGMVYIQKGAIRVYITSEEGREVTLFHISEGDCCVFSSACVIGGITLEVQMVAESEVELLAIHAGTVAKLMESNIRFKCFAYELSANRYSTVVWVMQQILFAHFDERMARLLLSQYEKTGNNTIRLTQEAMAREVNSAREVVARMLRKFESDGLIELKRGIVILKNIELLKNIVE